MVLLVWVVASVVLVVVWILKSMQSAVCVFFSKFEFSSLGGSICRVAHQCSGLLRHRQQ